MSYCGCQKIVLLCERFFYNYLYHSFVFRYLLLKGGINLAFDFEYSIDMRSVIMRRIERGLI